MTTLDAAGRNVHNPILPLIAFRIGAPTAPQRTAGEENRGPNAIAIVNGITL